MKNQYLVLTYFKSIFYCLIINIKGTFIILENTFFVLIYISIIWKYKCLYQMIHGFELKIQIYFFFCLCCTLNLYQSQFVGVNHECFFF